MFMQKYLRKLFCMPPDQDKKWVTPMATKTIESGRDIREWRRNNRYDQDMLAEELGVTRQTIGNWENKKGGIPRHIRIALQALEKFPGEFRKVYGKADAMLPR
jgi:DNA-binding XRE family transcriptional regulator